MVRGGARHVEDGVNAVGGDVDILGRRGAAQRGSTAEHRAPAESGALTMAEPAARSVNSSREPSGRISGYCALSDSTMRADVAASTRTSERAVVDARV